MFYYASIDSREILIKSTLKLDNTALQLDVIRCSSWRYRWLVLKYFFLFLVRAITVKAKAAPSATKELAIYLGEKAKAAPSAAKKTASSFSEKAKAKAKSLKDKSKRIKEIMSEK